MVIHDFECSVCGEVLADLPLSLEGSECLYCHRGTLQIHWHVPGRDAMAISEKQATVVYEHPVTKHVIWPGKNNVPMPERYQKEGYERKAMRSLREIDRFSKEHNVVHEQSHYNSGNAYDSEKGRR